MSVPPIVIWLADVVGKRTLNELFTRGDKRELRTMRRALADSQNMTDELRGIERHFDALYGQRDAMQSTVARLEIENAELRLEVVALKARLAAV